jgi:hypothetical protein
MPLTKKTEYILSAILAVYIVFFTRPAPLFVTNLLASPVAQIAALGAIIYVGANVSLVVSIIGALALVLSVPVREHLEMKDEKSKKPIDTVKESTTAPKPKEESAIKKEGKDATKPAKPTAAMSEPEPAGHKLESKPKSGSSSEAFTLMEAAPF